MSILKKKKGSVLKVLLVVWLIFTSIYFVFSEYQRLNRYVYAQGVEFGTQAGVRQAALSIIELGRACQPFPVVADDQRVDVIGMECLELEVTSSDSL